MIPWLNSTLGQYILNQEQLILDEAVANIFGFNALQLCLPGLDALRLNRIPNRFRLGMNQDCQLQADPLFLPIASHSVDLVVLPHQLEFSEYPHALLREIDRITVPEGRIIITGFNPLSLWGVRQFFSMQPKTFPWNGEFISLNRLKDWLSLLGFELNAGRFLAYVPPFRSEQLRQRFRFMELAGDRWWGVGGGVYYLEAIKRVQGVRLITPRWQVSMSEKVLSPAVQAASRQQDLSAKIVPLFPPQENS
ncbi:class I SAM-dependent methyltransferase [Ferrovum sp. JA12]|uniref:class I SAM-dependent methyltransferase n=1 Tax=Ferrovum sp. JA12 TaxID=1356299 RepID=UPI00128F1A56|nr:methyltransferase domain-containing protein [Ferrovum sp. JA12]